eukprot:scaffold7733_cov417-Prasinococcus_capsulatus_cf.AAC.1
MPSQGVRPCGWRSMGEPAVFISFLAHKLPKSGIARSGSSLRGQQVYKGREGCHGIADAKNDIRTCAWHQWQRLGYKYRDAEERMYQELPGKAARSLSRLTALVKVRGLPK